jgi:hypothetical protein
LAWAAGLRDDQHPQFVQGNVTDSEGNHYYLIVGPTVLTGPTPLSQAIYLAKKIPATIAGANSVTVTFNSTAAFPDIRILEYSGIDNTFGSGRQLGGYGQ